MEIWINGKQDTTLYNQSTLGDLLDHLQMIQTDEGQYPLRVRVDGETTEFSIPQVRNTALASIKKLEIEFATLNSMVDRNLQNAEDYLTRLIPGIERASELFRTENEQEANQYFLNIIDGVDWFSQVMDSVIQAKKIDTAQPNFAGKSIQSRKDRLLDLSKQLLDSNQNKDWVLLADLLEYELLPFYEDWAVILPEIRAIQPE